MAERLRADGILMEHQAFGVGSSTSHWWRASRGDTRSSWFRGKRGYGEAIRDLQLEERMAVVFREGVVA